MRFKNKSINYISHSLFFILLAVVIYSCSNPADTTIENKNPGILRTDETGRTYENPENDYSDWCYDTTSYSGVRSHLFAPYPNPADSTVNLNFNLAANDSVYIYFLKSAVDTAFVFRKTAFAAGTYSVTINSHHLGLAATYQRLYFVNKNGLTSTSKPCNNYGDILFTK